MADPVLTAAQKVLEAMVGFTPPTEDAKRALRQLEQVVALATGRDDAQRIADALKGKMISFDETAGTASFDFGNKNNPEPLTLPLRSRLFRGLVALIDKAMPAP